jgi:hypothetical protein
MIVIDFNVLLVIFAVVLIGVITLLLVKKYITNVSFTDLFKSILNFLANIFTGFTNSKK